jgi:hypothetical protein
VLEESKNVGKNEEEEEDEEMEESEEINFE